MKRKSKIIIVIGILLGLAYIPYYFYTKTNFEFDEAIHYSISDLQIEKADSIAVDSLLHEDFPTEISDTTFVSKLNKNRFKKKVIAIKNHSELKTIFRSQIGLGFLISTKCIPTYRDIIVLKSNNKITGIAKICFECDQHYFIGNSFFDAHFDEYYDLEQLLYNK